MAHTSLAERSEATTPSPAVRGMTFGDFARVMGIATRRWIRANVGELSAAIAYNALLSLAPLLLLLLAVTSRLLGSEKARLDLIDAVHILAGPAAAPAARTLMEMILDAKGGWLATAVSVLVMIPASSGVFQQLRSALDRIWGVNPRVTLRHLVFERVLSVFAVPAGVVVVLLTMLLSVAGAVAAPKLTALGWLGTWTWGVLSGALPYGLLTVLFALVFKLGPHARIEWRDVWGGAALTAFLFTVGNVGIGFLIGRNLAASIYGAAGVIVVGMLWIYYAAQLLLFGAYFTRVYAERFGSRAPGRRVGPEPRPRRSLGRPMSRRNRSAG